MLTQQITRKIIVVNFFVPYNTISGYNTGLQTT